MQRLTDAYPEVQSYAVTLGVGLLNSGNLLRDLGQHQAALESYARAQRTLGGVLMKEPRHEVAKLALAKVHGGKALTLARLARHADAAVSIAAAFELCPDQSPAEL